MGVCASNRVMDFTTINDIDSFRKYIDYCRRTNAYEKIKQKFRREKIIDANDILTSGGEGPYNAFASMVSRDTPNRVDQSLLGEYTDNFMLCHNNKPIRDEKWNDPNFSGASMAGPDINGPGHVFITTKNLHVDYFNILPIVLKKDVRFLEEILYAALEYSKNRGWTNPGFYFHTYPLNSVQSLHLHVINKDKLGPMFYKKQYNNLDIYDALSVL